MSDNNNQNSRKERLDTKRDFAMSLQDAENEEFTKGARPQPSSPIDVAVQVKRSVDMAADALRSMTGALVYPAPFSSDMTRSFVSDSQGVLVTTALIKNMDASNALRLQAKDLDWRLLLRLFGEDYEQCIAVITAVLTNSTLLTDIIYSLIPRTGSLSRYRTNSKWVAPDFFPDVADKCIAAVAKRITDQKKLNGTWKRRAKLGLLMLLRSMFAPLNIEIDPLDVVTAVGRDDIWVNHKYLTAVAHALALRDALVQANPSAVFKDASDVLNPGPLADRLIQFTRQFTVAYESSSYLVDKLLKTAFELVYARMRMLAVGPNAPLEPSEGTIAIPVEHMKNPLLDSFVRNITLVEMALSAPRALTSELVSEASFAAALELLAKVISDDVFFKRVELSAFKDYVSTTFVRDSQSRKLALLVDTFLSHDLKLGAVATSATLTSQNAKNSLSYTRQSPLVADTLAALSASYQPTDAIDARVGLLRNLERERVEVYRNGAVVICTPGVTDRLLTYAAAAYAPSVRLFPTVSEEWAWVFEIPVESANVAQAITAPLGRISTSAAGLALYLSAEDKQASKEYRMLMPRIAELSNALVDVDQLCDNKVFYSGAMTVVLPDVEKPGGVDVTIAGMDPVQFLNILDILDLHYLWDYVAHEDIESRFTAILRAVETTRKDVAAGKLTEVEGRRDIELATASAFMWLASAGMGGPIGQRVASMLNGAITTAPRQQRALFTVAATSAVTLVTVGATYAGYLLVNLGLLRVDTLQKFLAVVNEVGWPAMTADTKYVAANKLVATRMYASA